MVSTLVTRIYQEFKASRPTHVWLVMRNYPTVALCLADPVVRRSSIPVYDWFIGHTKYNMRKMTIEQPTCSWCLTSYREIVGRQDNPFVQK